MLTTKILDDDMIFSVTRALVGSLHSTVKRIVLGKDCYAVLKEPVYVPDNPANVELRV
jgi:hypothetical protein